MQFDPIRGITDADSTIQKAAKYTCINGVQLAYERIVDGEKSVFA